jgi:hypothetical protein
MRKHFADVRDRLSSIIEDGRHDGTVNRLPADARVAASMLMSLHDGMVFQWMVDPEQFPVDAYADAVLEWLGLASTS